MKTLVIVESPSKCKLIEKYLGEEYKVIGSYGHITTLKTLEQIDFNTYNIKYKNEKLSVIKNIKNEIKNSKNVILATDDDREGEAIAWHICNVCNLDVNTTIRIKFNEITKKALLNSLENKGVINMNRVNSQKCRQLLDLYIGFKISPKLWKYIANKLSAGRCQIPALNIIYENELSIENTSKETNYKVYGIFTNNNIKFILTNSIEKEEIQDFLEKSKHFIYKLINITKKEVTENRPSILTTISLQQLASNSLSLSPIQTMSYAQVLYENGNITYMRTDSSTYSDEFKNELECFIKKKYGDKYTKSIVNNEKKAHEGIRVTDLLKETTDYENEYINKLYSLIYKHTIKTGMSDSLNIKYNYELTAPLNNIYSYTEKIILFKGWKIINQDKPSIIYGEYLNKINQINNISIIANEVLKNQIFHLTESQIIKRLENKGIGRPSTYASILEKILKKGYVKKGKINGDKINITNYIFEDNNIKKEEVEKYSLEESGKLKITPIGKETILFCYKYYKHIFNYEYTENMENELDLIEYSDTEWISIFKKFKEIIDKDIIIDEPNKINKSINCGIYNNNNLIIKNGKYGYYINYNKKNSSLLEWEYYKNIEEFIDDQYISVEVLNSLINYISIIIIDKTLCIKKGKYGEYIYYKTKTMKKPKFLKLEIESRNIEDLKGYIKNKYNIIC